MRLLFGAIALGLAVIAVAAWRGGAWPISVAALAIGVWMASLAVGR